MFNIMFLQKMYIYSDKSVWNTSRALHCSYWPYPPCCLVTRARCGDVSVNGIDPWCRWLVISASAVRLSISVHLQRHPTNGGGIQFASIVQKLFCFVVLLTCTIKQNQCGGTYRQAAGWQRALLPYYCGNRSIHCYCRESADNWL